MKTVWTSFALAWNLLTIIPLSSRSHTDVHPHALASSLGWYPFVGFVLGTFLVLGDRVLSGIVPDALVNLLLLTLLIILTGALHQDGLADTIDALAGGKSREHRLAILKDGRIGAIGATGLILSLGLRYAGLMSLVPESREAFLLCMPAVGRWSMVLGAWWGSYPRPEGGLAAPFIQYVSLGEVFLATMIIGIGFLYMMSPLTTVGLLLLILLGVRVLVWCATRLFGGITGDILGTTNELMEIMFLLCAPLSVAVT
jgi:adenosylcobinamide-GDP ribazoletransferase